MLADIIKNVFKNFKVFLVIWIVMLIANQLFIFGGCMKGYCILAASPHTGIISALITYFVKKDEVEE